MQRIPASRRGEYAENTMWFTMKTAGVHAARRLAPSYSFWLLMMPAS